MLAHRRCEQSVQEAETQMPDPILDNASSHVIEGMETIKVGSFDSFKLSNLLPIFLPANCTSIIQPLDQDL